MPAHADSWKRIETDAEFRETFVDRSFVGDGAQFTIHADGTLTGEIDGTPLSGTWHWSAGLFCRTATLGNENLGTDCELVEVSADRMRYTRDSGKGSSTIVRVAPSAR